jgi:signal transduction histidine kinase
VRRVTQTPASFVLSRAGVSSADGRSSPRRRVWRIVIVIVIIAAIEAVISFIDAHVGDTVPAAYLYFIPSILGGLYLGFMGGVAVPIASIVLFHFIEKSGLFGTDLAHRAYQEGDILLLVLLILVGVIVANLQHERRRSRRQVQELKALNRIRDELTALIVHDLRTPLAALVNVLRMVSEEDGPALPPTHRDLLLLSLATGEDMAGMISDLLQIHAMESGALQLHEEDVRPSAVVEAAIRQVAPIARQREVTVEAHADDSLPTLRADEDLLVRVLVNLLGNALRFSPASSVVVVAAQREGADLIFSVADRGPGIPPALQDRVFDKFARADHDVGRHLSTGLGLTFAKMAVEAHHGRIWLESPWRSAESPDPITGSRFSVSLPLGPRA